MRIILLCLIICFLSGSLQAAKKYHYTYSEREHTWDEDLRHLSLLYAISWPVYYLTQTRVFEQHGSWKRYRDHFAELTFDRDRPFWNWGVHPYLGSQLYLYYRANSYSPWDGLKMTFLSSVLVEFLVEIYTEPASIQDLYQTPVLGLLLGMALEHSSLPLLNSPYWTLRLLGYILNPFSLLGFYEGNMRLHPQFDVQNKRTTLMFTMDF